MFWKYMFDIYYKIKFTMKTSQTITANVFCRFFNSSLIFTFKSFIFRHSMINGLLKYIRLLFLCLRKYKNPFHNLFSCNFKRSSIILSIKLICRESLDAFFMSSSRLFAFSNEIFLM